MIKLVKLIFRHVRSFQKMLKSDLCKFIEENKKSIEYLLIEINIMSAKHSEEIGMKNMRVL